jgi:hypothetical protein
MNNTNPSGNPQEEIGGGSLRSPSAARSEYVETDPEALFPVGALVEYKEDDSILFCKVLENTSDKEWLRYKLEVVQEYSPHFVGGHAKPGEVFDPCRNRQYSFSGMWHILPLGTYTREKDWPAASALPSLEGEK